MRTSARRFRCFQTSPKEGHSYNELKKGIDKSIDGTTGRLLESSGSSSEAAESLVIETNRDEGQLRLLPSKKTG